MIRTGTVKKGMAYYAQCMPMVNQASQPEKFPQLKVEFGALSSAGKVPAETAVLIDAVFMLLKMMVAIFLEKSTSKNSSLLPSQTDKDDSATTPGSQPRGSGRRAQRFGNTPTIETTTIVEVQNRGRCGEDYGDIGMNKAFKRTFHWMEDNLQRIVAAWWMSATERQISEHEAL